MATTCAPPRCALDRVPRLVVVTPDMHRVHHSVPADVTNSNFVFMPYLVRRLRKKK